MIRAIFALLVLPSTLDAFIRGWLAHLSRHAIPAGPRERPRRWLVVIPSRDEGAKVLRTVDSVARAASGADVRTVVLLDGDDDAAATALAASNATVLVKRPAGPTKAAALRWLVAEHRRLLDEADAVALFDVGSAAAEDFFSRFDWPDGAAAAQAILVAAGEGAGQGAAVSERLAQSGEDAGRERLGWGVRLRGTGMVFRPEALIALAPALVTQIEDEEATLVMRAEGRRIVLAREAFVFDEKPSSAVDAAGQRARWIAGRLELLWKHPRNVVRLTARNPGEGLAFVLGLTGRPLALSGPLRLFGGLILVALSLRPLRIWAVAAGAAAAATALADARRMVAGGAGPGAMLRLGGSWVRALLLAPRALIQWMKVRRP